MAETYKGLTDQYGLPIPKAPIVEEVAAPMLSGARSLWNDTVASGLSPQRLARILRESAELGGETRHYLTLAEEIEERDLHYRSVLHSRKLALRGLTPVIEAASTNARDVEIANRVRALVTKPGFRGAMLDLADGLAKGYSAVEMMWVTGPDHWTINEFKFRDPRLFQFDRVAGTELRLRDDSDWQGVPLPPAKFIVHVPKLKSGMPIRSGLARVAMWAFLLKSFSLKDWMAFLDVYGIPWRVGKWHAGASDNDKRALLRAVTDIAADGACIIPESMLIELIEAKSASATDAFEKICNYLDRQVSKAVLGQTMTADDGSSLAQAKVHNEVRLDIGKADADELAATVQRDLVQPFVFFNFGMPANGFPKFSLPVIEPEDLKALMEVTGSFVDRGGRVSMAEVRDKLGWSDPDKNEEVLVPLKRSARSAQDDGESDAPTADLKHPTRRRAAARAGRCLQCGLDHAHASQRFSATQVEDDIEQVAADALADWEPIMTPIVDPLLKLVAECKDFDELKRRLPQLRMDTTEFEKRLTSATMIARGLGDLGE